MNKNEYMKLLRRELRHLPREDYLKAVDYFEEYFEDAGLENEAQAIEDLGNPQDAAEQIIRDFAVENSKGPAQGVKKGLDAIWVGILAVFAAPLALPLLLCGVVLVMCAIIVVLALLFSFFAVGLVMLVSLPICIYAGLTVVTHSVPIFLSCLGHGFVYTGLGILITYGTIVLIRYFLHGIVRLFGRMAGRRR